MAEVAINVAVLRSFSMMMTKHHRNNVISEPVTVSQSAAAELGLTEDRKFEKRTNINTNISLLV